MQLFVHGRHTFGRLSLRCIYVHLVVVQKLAQPLKQLNTYVHSGGNKKLPIGRLLLAKHTSHKHPHHDEPLSPLASWFPWINIPHPREPLQKGLDEAAIEGFEKQL